VRHEGLGILEKNPPHGDVRWNDDIKTHLKEKGREDVN
jgi:hypothetical protein